MTITRLFTTAATLAALVLIAPASAQETASLEENPAAETSAAEVASPEAGAENDAPDPDEMADQLNSAQQLQQTVTLKRTVDGEVVETEKRTVTFSRDTPYRETEAGRTTIERLKNAFDGEALTRTEAFEEAKLDFVIADVDRDEAMTAEEFGRLVASWRENEARQAAAPNKEVARQRQYEAFLSEIDPAAAVAQDEAYAKQKFSFMAGAAETMSLQDYIREYLLDFDSMDKDQDMVLNDEELMKFRALNRGETLDM